MSRGLQVTLRKTVGELMSSKAVDTTSTMKEFRNDADLRWILTKGYNAILFLQCSWPFGQRMDRLV